MPKENIILKLDKIATSSSIDARDELLAELRAYPLKDMDSRREQGEWKKVNIYFHALTNTMFVAEFGHMNPRYTKQAQACFVKDLEYYLAGLPKKEAEMRKLFQNILYAGVSFRWNDDLEKVKKLHEFFTRLNEEIIKPWASI